MNFSKINKNNKKAFTMAEILITLTVIGIISALTIPNIIKNTKNKETVTRLQKAYSLLSGVTNQILAEEGSPKNWISSNQKFYELYKNKLNTIKECYYAEECMPQGAYKKFNGQISDSIFSSGSYAALVLSDGAQVIFQKNTFQNCNKDFHYGYGIADGCGLIWVDINGEKKPNQYGRDLFSFILKKNGLYPRGCDTGNLLNATCTSAVHNGMSCACKVLKEGAINY